MRKKLTAELLGLMRLYSERSVTWNQALSRRLRLNLTDLETIEVLRRLTRTTAGVIAKETGLTTGAVTSVIDRLERTGYAKREFDPDDRRKVFVTLNTETVTTTITPLHTSISGSIEKISHQYSKKELEILVGFMRKSLLAHNQAINELTSKET